MMGGGGAPATPTGSPFANFNYDANLATTTTTTNTNTMSSMGNNATNLFGANVTTMNNASNASVFGQSNNAAGGTTTFGATAPGSSTIPFLFGQNTGVTNNVPASSIFGANPAPTPASIFGQTSTLNTGGFGQITPSKPSNTVNTGFGAFGQPAQSTAMDTTQNNNNVGGFTFGMTPSSNINQDNAMDSTSTSFGRHMSLDKSISSVTFGSNDIDTNKAAFGGPTTNTTTTSGFTFSKSSGK
jgi:hypothetical protein